MIGAFLIWDYLEVLAFQISARALAIVPSDKGIELASIGLSSGTKYLQQNRNIAWQVASF